jgi:hypothetical protein
MNDFSDELAFPLTEATSARGPEGIPKGADDRPLVVTAGATEAPVRGFSRGVGVAVGVGFDEGTEGEGCAVYLARSQKLFLFLDEP